VQNLDRASHVYVSRLMALAVADGEPWYSTLSGRISVVRTLKGGAPKASAVLELVRGDQSVIDVSDDFTTKGGAGKTAAIEPVQDHLSRLPLSADFPGEYRLEATVSCPAMPPPR